MGWPSQLFLDPPDDDLVCGICFDVLRDPQSACTHGHTYCGGCLARCSGCPSCRANLICVPSRPLGNLIGKLRVRCTSPERGSPEPAPRRRRLNDGSTSSDSADVPRGLAGGTHGFDEAAAPEEPPQASPPTDTTNRTRHVCAWTGALGSREAHRATCPHASVDCPFKSIGCLERVARSDLEEHLTSCRDAHATLALAAAAQITKLQQTVEERDATIAQRDATIVGMQAEIDVVRRPLGMLPSPLLARGPRGLSADGARASLGSVISPANEPTLRAPSELETSVLRCFARRTGGWEGRDGDGFEGLTVEEIMEDFGSETQDAVRDAVDWLCNEGYIYTTYDEEHFKYTE